MLTASTRHRPGTASVLAAIALACAVNVAPAAAPAAAMEEVVIHGSGDMSMRAYRAQFEAQMATYAQEVRTALKDEMRQDLARAAAPRIRVARSGNAHRG